MVYVLSVTSSLAPSSRHYGTPVKKFDSFSVMFLQFSNTGRWTENRIQTQRQAKGPYTFTHHTHTHTHIYIYIHVYVHVYNLLHLIVGAGNDLHFQTWSISKELPKTRCTELYNIWTREMYFAHCASHVCYKPNQNVWLRWFDVTVRATIVLAMCDSCSCH
jgi:hypothetical protein